MSEAWAPRKPTYTTPSSDADAFGMGAETLVSYARKNFGVAFTLNEATTFRAQFLEHYDGIRKWQNSMGVNSKDIPADR